MKKALVIFTFLIVAVTVISQQPQDRQYTLKGTTEQMIALRKAVDASQAPYSEVIKVQEWLIPQLIEQDQAFAKADSIKAKGAK